MSEAASILSLLRRRTYLVPEEDSSEDCEKRRLFPLPLLPLPAAAAECAMAMAAKSSWSRTLTCWKGLHDWHVHEHTERMSIMEPAPSACQWSTSLCWRITSPSSRTLRAAA